MTSTPPNPPGSQESQQDPGQHGPRVTRDQATDLGRLRRSTTDRHVAGVAGGLARHLDIDPIIVRVSLVVLAFFGGAGILVYAALWLLVPEDTDDSAPLGLDDRNRSIALVVVGVLAVLAMLGDWSGGFWFPWPLVAVGLAALWLVNRGRSQGPRPGTYPATPAPPADPSAEAPYAGEPGGDQHGEQHGDQHVGVDQYAWQYTGRPTGQHPPTSYRPPANPRRRGPILFWITLALIAVGFGTLGIIDVAGTAVPDATYPALALATTGVMLVLGAFWGRAGGLILLGLLAGVATLGATAADNWEGDGQRVAPTSSSQVEDEYHMDAGQLVLDLTRVDDVEDLDGRDLEVDGGLGEVVVIVPDGMDVTARADVGVGGSEIFGREGGGFGTSRSGFVDGGTDVPVLSVQVDLGVGHVTVHEQ